jgi:hypothetical protein
MTSGAVIDTAGSNPQPSVRTPLRVLGILTLVLSVAMLIVPTSYGWLEGRPGTSACGVPLQALFNPPGYGCTSAAYTQAAKSAVVAVVGVGILAFSGIRRRLRFLGLAAIGLSPFPMLFSSNEFQPVMGDGFAEICGSAIGDLVRRGYTSVGFQGGEGPLSPACGDRALSRLYLTLGMAGVGVIILAVEAIRRRKAQAVVS